MKCKYVSIIILLFVVSRPIQSQSFTFEEIPKWVKQIEIPSKSAISVYDIKNGYYNSLVDNQINLKDETIYNRQIKNLISFKGITEASQIYVSYDSSYQKLQIHHLYIWRNEKKIDRTKDLSFEIMNNEYGLNAGIYTGRVNIYDILEDIRKDDKIEFAYSLVGFNPIFDDKKHLLIALESMNPIDKYSIRVLFSKNEDYNYTCNDCDSINYKESIIDEYKVIEMSKINLKALDLEKSIPTWIIPYEYFILSSYHSWSDVNTWAQKVFSLKNEPNLIDVFEEIFTGKEKMDDKINKIINYVQDEIRYMGIESGIGSIKPFTPEEVVKQRFGDCKDKSLLLVSLLKKIGIEEAYPVLVNTSMQHNTEQYLPSGEVFNHCIAKFVYNDTTYWVDPTITQQGGDYRDLFNKDYGKVLIIGEPDDTLHNMVSVQSKNSLEVIEKYTMNSFSEPGKLEITSKRYGGAADQRRAFLEYYSSKDLSDLISENLKYLFPIVNENKDIILQDSIENNVFTTIYNYDIDDFWIDGDKNKNKESFGLWIFRFEPILIYQYLSKSSCEERINDYEINHPISLNYKTILHLPKDLFLEDDIDIFENEAFYYEEKVEQLSSNSFQIDYTFRTKTNVIKAEKYKKICESMNSITKEAPVVIYFNKY